MDSKSFYLPDRFHFQCDNTAMKPLKRCLTEALVPPAAETVVVYGLFNVINDT